MAEQQNQELNLVRIAGRDIDASLPLLHGLARIRGVSHMFSNAVCVALGYDKNTRISELSEEDIQNIEGFLSNPKKEGIPSWLLNNQRELDTGEDHHYVGKDIEYNHMQLKRRLAKIKSYRGLRHKFGLTLRGQRTKANFRRQKTLASMRAKAQQGKR